MGLTHEAYKSNTENIKVVKKAMTAWNRNVVLLRSVDMWLYLALLSGLLCLVLFMTFEFLGYAALSLKHIA